MTSTVFPPSRPRVPEAKADFADPAAGQTNRPSTAQRHPPHSDVIHEAQTERVVGTASLGPGSERPTLGL